MIRFRIFRRVIAIDSGVIFVVMPLYWTGGIFYSLLVFCSILLHEAGHMAAAKWKGGRVLALKLMPAGTCAVMELGHLDRRVRCGIFLAGPVVNLILAGFCYWIIRVGFQWRVLVQQLLMANLCIAMINLLPVFPLDGGRMMMELLSWSRGRFWAMSAVRRLTMISGIGMILTALLAWIYSRGNVGLTVIGIFILFSQENIDLEAAMMNIKELVNRRARLQAKGVYAVRDIVVLRGLSIGEAIRNMDYDKFHLVYVIDDEFGHMATFTEQEIMDAVLGHDSDMTFDQLIMMKKEEKEGVSSGSGGIF